VNIPVPAFDGMALATQFTLAAVRPLAMLALLPGFAGAPLPWRARLALVSALASFAAFRPGAPLLAPAMLPAELMAGLVAGVALAAAFAAAQLAGEVAAQMIGLGFANLGPEGGNVTALSGLFGLLMWGVLLASGAHLELLGALVAGQGAAPSGGITLAGVAALGSTMFAHGLAIALPVIGVLLLGNALVAIASRAAPQLSAMAVGPALLLMAFVSALPLLFLPLWGRLDQALNALLAWLPQ